MVSDVSSTYVPERKPADVRDMRNALSPLILTEAGHVGNGGEGDGGRDRVDGFGGGGDGDGGGGGGGDAGGDGMGVPQISQPAPLTWSSLYQVSTSPGKSVLEIPVECDPQNTFVRSPKCT